MTRKEKESLADLFRYLSSMPRILARFKEQLAAIPELVNSLVDLETAASKTYALADHVIEESPWPDPEPLSAEELARVLQINRRLKSVMAYLVETAGEVRARMEAKTRDSSDPMGDFEIEVELDYILREDDPEFDEDGDNVLTSRSDHLLLLADTAKHDEHGYLGPTPYDDLLNEPHCWLFHDLYDHSWGPDRPRLSIQDCARIGKVWIDVQVWQQYFFDLDRGEWDERPYPLPPDGVQDGE